MNKTEKIQIIDNELSNLYTKLKMQSLCIHSDSYENVCSSIQKLEEIKSQLSEPNNQKSDNVSSLTLVKKDVLDNLILFASHFKDAIREGGGSDYRQGENHVYDSLNHKFGQNFLMKIYCIVKENENN